MIALNQIYNLDALEMAKQLPDQSTHCIITSPPYYGVTGGAIRSIMTGETWKHVDELESEK